MCVYWKRKSETRAEEKDQPFHELNPNGWGTPTRKDKFNIVSANEVYATGPHRSIPLWHDFQSHRVGGNGRLAVLVKATDTHRIIAGFCNLVESLQLYCDYEHLAWGIRAEWHSTPIFYLNRVIWTLPSG